MASGNAVRISREIAEIQRGEDLSIAVAHQEADIRKVRALILGPPGTPYEYGLFEFDVVFGPEYPLKAPEVTALTTGSGKCRFNPNIYANGKVCLSILGTWEGDPGEQWSSAQGLESILLSIQSLLSSTPYENEPGFENAVLEGDKEASEDYSAKIRHEVLRVSVIQRLERILNIQPNDSVQVPREPEVNEGNLEEKTSHNSKKDCIKAPLFRPFDDVYKRRFLWYFTSHLSSIRENQTKFPEGQLFKHMPFESKSNGLYGTYRYSRLESRLIRIKKALDQEVENWVLEGQMLVQNESNLAFRLMSQFKDFACHQRKKNLHNIEVVLHEGNPFAWMMTYFGRPGSDLEGGMFRIRLNMSPRFPDEQPRVRVETPMYHHRVSTTGTLYYSAGETGEVKHHVEAILLALEEISPPYDPRAAVNLEAMKLFWGNETEKKYYARKQRRSAEESMSVHSF